MTNKDKNALLAGLIVYAVLASMYILGFNYWQLWGL